MCGIFAVYNHPDASQLVKFGLHALQHRGEEAAGIASTDGNEIYIMKKRGLVGDIFSEEDCKKLPGNIAIGHVRYSTRGGPSGTNTQPLFAKLQNNPIAIAHNGQISNSYGLRKYLESNGTIFQTSTDTEDILHLMAHSNKHNIWYKLKSSLKSISGSYSLLVLTIDDLIVARDPVGIRPLVVGEKDGAILVSSESCAITFLGGKVIRDVFPGEQTSLSVLDRNKSGCYGKLCVFEHIYFSRSDSIIEGISVYNSRIGLGRELAKENPVDADICVPVPDSGIVSTLGYCKESRLSYEKGIIRSHYGRSFIQPGQLLRNRKIWMKLNPVASVLKNKRIVLVDDSIVRGNTSKRVVDMLKEVGVKEIHMKISSPPIKFPCYYGIDTPESSELIASSHSVEEIRKIIGCDTLSYLSYDGMIKATQPNCCDACFTGKYPIGRTNE